MRQDHNGGGLSWSLGKMQIVGPYSVAGIYQDAGASPVAPAAPIAPVAAAAGGTSSGQTRGETGQRGQTPARPAFPTPDPNRPAGPPPAFDTTPLELEAERRQSEASVLWRSGAQTTQAAEPAERQLDIEV
jgi:hypothetical protein